MRQIIPFEKKVDFHSHISQIMSISLEHSEKVIDGEIQGEFLIFGDYKKHSDTTEVEEFKYNIPYTMILPDSIDVSTVRVDISNFTYDILEESLNVFIEYSIEADDLPEILDEIIEDTEIEEYITDRNDEKEHEKVVPIENNEYVVYHIHIVEEKDTIESIIKKYDVLLEDIQEYNDITKLSVGDKIIIPYHE